MGQLLAFVSAPRGQFGDSGVGILTAPGFRNLDLSVSKQFKTAGRQYFLLRGEAFNVTNCELRAAGRQHPEHGIQHHHVRDR